MVSQTNEAALETHIETALVKDGYRVGNPADFDRTFAVDRQLFWEFLESTQPQEVAKLKDRPNWQRLVLERLSKKIKKDSVLAVLKKGLDVDDAHFDLLYRQPYNQLNPEVLAVAREGFTDDGLIEDLLAEADEGADDIDAHRDGPRAAEDAGGHDGAVFGENEREVLPVPTVAALLQDYILRSRVGAFL